MEILIGLFLLGAVGFAIWALSQVATGKTVSGNGNAHLTEQLVSQAKKTLASANIPKSDKFTDIVFSHITFDRPGDELPVYEVMGTIEAVIEKLHQEEGFTTEIEPPLVAEGIEGARYRDRLNAFVAKMTDENIRYSIVAVINSLDAFLRSLPPFVYRPRAEVQELYRDGSLSFSLPLVDSVERVGEAVSDVIGPFFVSRVRDARMFGHMREQLTRNLYEASKQDYPPRPNTSPRLILPKDCKTGTPREIVYRYLKDTPLLHLFGVFVPFTIPHLTRFEHHWIVSPPGTGKSTALSMMILKDLDRVARGEASVIVMESNRDLIKAIEGLKRFAPGGDLAGRLVLIDVEDVDWPIAINLFDIGLSQINNASPRDREALLNSAVSMLDYVFRALLGAELTSRQSTLFNFTIQLLIHIPNATLDTLLDLMQPKGLYKYAQYLDDLDPDTKQFFELKFNAKEFEQTKSQVTDRIFAIKRIRSLARMFSAPKTKLDLFKEMGEGKVILINAAKSLLQEDGVEVFGRFFLASILLAAEKRQLLAKDDRLATFVYIDECQDVLRRDEKITVLLDQARKFRVAMIMAHQRVEQLTPPVVSALMGSTAIKFAAQLSDSNASAMARNMGTTPDFIANQPQYSYAASVRGLTKTAMSLQIPFVDLNALPRMTEREAEAVRDDMRKRYAIDPKIEPPPPEVEDVEAEYVAPEKPTPRPPREKAAPRDVEVEVIRLGPPKPKRLTKGYVPPDDDAPKEW